MPTYLERRKLGKTRLEVTPLCMGTSPMTMPEFYGYRVEPTRAVAAVLAAFDGPINFLDTSNEYGQGDSERLVGEAVRSRRGLPAGFVLATKVDPDPETREFSGRRVRVSVEESLERLGLDHLPLLYLHDPERIGFEEAMVRGGPVEALVKLRAEGLVDYIGVAGGPIGLMTKYVATDVFDVVLTHRRYTLLDRSAESLLDAANLRGMGVINAAAYSGGMLVKGPDKVSRYAGMGHPSFVDTARKMRVACEGRNVPLAAAALQFSVRDPRIHSTVVGMSAPERIDQTVGLLEVTVPDELWDELRRLSPPKALWLG